MRSFRCCLFAVALGLPMLLPAIAGAQPVGEWKSRGPFCAIPHGLAASKSPTTPAYLAVGGSLFRSLDGWATWSRVGANLPASYLSAVAVAPKNLRLVYFAIWGEGIFRSSDGGETWSRIFRGLPDPLVEHLMVPADPGGTVFAVASYSGIYRSRDRGETWVDISPTEPRPSNFYSVQAHPLHPERLAAHTLRGLWRSSDGGNTWKAWNSGLPVDPDGVVAGLNSLTLSPGERDIAFVASYQTLYRSKDGGSWKRIGPIPVNNFAYVYTLIAGPGAPPVLFVGQDGDPSATPGVLRSLDAGKTWQPLPLLGESVGQLSFLPTLGRVVALTTRGAFYSSDLGATWQRTGNGVVSARVLSLAAAGSGGEILIAGLAGCHGGIARSPDHGKTWQIQEIRDPGLYYGSMLTDVESLASAPSRPLRVYAGSIDEVLRSDDGGLTWTHHPFNDHLSGGHTVALAVHPMDPDLVFAAGDHGISRSRDGGHTWSSGLPEHPFTDMTAVVFDPGQPQRMLAAAWSGGLMRSVDTGASWQPIPGTDFLRVGALAIHPRDSNLVLASSLFADTSLYRSEDGGSNWAPSDIGIEGTIRGLTFSADGAEVFATGDEGVFRSTDGGRTWQRMNDAPAPVRAFLWQANGLLHVGTDVGVASRAGTAVP
jgi:photosystem II stability/assembly factor-like uncharacterized protein